MTSLHPNTFTPALNNALQNVKNAGSFINAAQAKSFIAELNTAYASDAKQFGADFVRSCPAFTEYQAASARLQDIAAAATNRISDGRR